MTLTKCPNCLREYHKLRYNNNNEWYKYVEDMIITTIVTIFFIATFGLSLRM